MIFQARTPDAEMTPQTDLACRWPCQPGTQPHGTKLISYHHAETGGACWRSTIHGEWLFNLDYHIQFSVSGSQ